MYLCVCWVCVHICLYVGVPLSVWRPEEDIRSLKAGISKVCGLLKRAGMWTLVLVSVQQALLTIDPPFQLERLPFETLIYILCSLEVDRPSQYPMEKEGIKFSPTGGKFTYIIWIALPIGLFLSSITYLYIRQLYGEGSQILDLLFRF